MDANSLLKRIVLVGIVSTLPAFALAAPPGGGHGGGGHGGGGHGGGGGGRGGGGHFSGGRGAIPVGYSRGYGHGGSWHGGSWGGGSGRGHHGSWQGHGNWHGHGFRHRRVSFGFYPYWYPGWGYYDYGYGYGYGYPYYADDYDDYYYPDSSYYGQRASADESAGALVQDSLARRGYYGGQVDGVIGPETRGAIREFQHDNGLAVNGRITPQLIQTLRNGND
jgi:Putative peptidoglycan binding domain